MELVYVFHSGFAVLSDKASLLFDYYEDTDKDHGFVHEELLKRPEPLYVFSSHFHQDHFNPEIFKFKEKKDNIVYILSADIARKRSKYVKDQDYIKLRKGGSFEDDLIKVKAFGSTDIGVSFAVNLEGKEIFHSGDLNNWHWMDESTQEEWQGYEKSYLDELSYIKKDKRSFDLVMFPVDPRLHEEKSRGARQFLDAFNVKVLAPMHFFFFSEDDEKLLQSAKEHDVLLLNIKKRGQKFSLPW